MNEFNLDKINYPVSTGDLPIVEHMVPFRLNVFTFRDDEGRLKERVYISQKPANNGEKEIDLLYWNEHYAWIKNFAALFYDVTKNRNRKYFCKKCFSHFRIPTSYQKHIEICNGNDVTHRFQFPSEGEIQKLTNICHQLRSPIVVYCDCECLLTPQQNNVEISND